MTQNAQFGDYISNLMNNSKPHIKCKETVGNLCLQVQNNPKGSAEYHKALTILIETNIRIIFQQASKRVKNLIHQGSKDIDPEAIFQDGFMGLIHAIEKFEPEKGFALSTYAMWWIKQNIDRQHQNNSKVIRVPIHAQKIYSIYKKHQKDAERLGERVDIKAVLKAIEESTLPNSTEKTLMETVIAMEAMLTSTMMDENGEMEDIAQTIEAEEGQVTPERLEIALDAEELMTVLTPKEVQVIKWRFYDDMTLEECGQELGVTRERIRQIEAKALKKMRAASKGDLRTTKRDSKVVKPKTSLAINDDKEFIIGTTVFRSTKAIAKFMRWLVGQEYNSYNQIEVRKYAEYAGLSVSSSRQTMYRAKKAGFIDIVGVLKPVKYKKRKKAVSVKPKKSKQYSGSKIQHACELMKKYKNLEVVGGMMGIAPASVRRYMAWGKEQGFIHTTKIKEL